MIKSSVEVVLARTWLRSKLQNSYLGADEVVTVSVPYYEKKTIRFQYSVKDQKIHGLCRIWYSNGSLLLEEYYDHNVLDGIQKEWHSNGQLKNEVNYKRGMLDGLCQEWDEDGKQQTMRFYIRDVIIPTDIYELIKNRKLTAKTILESRNTEVRRICFEELGYAQFLAQVEHQVIEKDGEYELVMIDWHKREEPMCLVKVKCPSTGAFYALRVPPSMQTVKEAVAWTFGLKAEEYHPEKET